MANKVSLKIKAFGQPEQTSVGNIEVNYWNSSERMMRGGKLLGGAWFAAALSILVPVLHFVLVPLFLLLGPLLFYIAYQQEESVIGGQVPCPACAQPVKVSGGKLKWPIFDHCSSCQTRVRIEKAD